MISFACPKCGKNLSTKDDQAGKRGKCPHCRSVFAIPSALDEPAPSRLSAGGESNGVAEAPTLQFTKEGTRDSNRPSGDKPVQGLEFLAPALGPGEMGRLGNYRILQVLGAGGMGMVLRAEDTLLNRPVALKVMLPALAANKTNRERFEREAQLAAAIEHEHIVTIYQVGEDGGVPYLAMPLLQGESLERRLHRDKPMPLREILRIGKEAAEGLAAAHERGLIHRDIKPANIWLEGDKGRVKILDFGLARSVQQDKQLTQSGMIIGTPAYMAPEQAGGKNVDGRCDLFSLGCVLYRMIAKVPPFERADTISTLSALAIEDPTSLLEIDAAIPAPLADLIHNLLAKKPADRPASARAVIDILCKIEAGDMADSAKTSFGSRPDTSTRLPKPSPLWLWIAVACTAIVLFLLGAWAMLPTAPRAATVVVDIDQPGAEVSVDGKVVRVLEGGDEKSVTFDAQPGHHELKISRAGFAASVTTFDVAAGANQTTSIHLEKIAAPTARVEVAAVATPKGAAPVATIPRKSKAPPVAKQPLDIKTRTYREELAPDALPLYENMRIRNVNLQSNNERKRTFKQGDIIKTNIQLFNSSDKEIATITVNAGKSPIYLLGHIRTWIERLGDDAEIPVLASAAEKRGRNYLLNADRMLGYHKASIAPGSEVGIGGSIDTAQFPTGTYLVHLEYTSAARIAAWEEPYFDYKVDFELTPFESVPGTVAGVKGDATKTPSQVFEIANLNANKKSYRIGESINVDFDAKSVTDEGIKGQKEPLTKICYFATAVVFAERLGGDASIPVEADVPIIDNKYQVYKSTVSQKNDDVLPLPFAQHFNCAIRTSTFPVGEYRIHVWFVPRFLGPLARVERATLDIKLE